jgi:hypothetical protein
MSELVRTKIAACHPIHIGDNAPPEGGAVRIPIAAMRQAADAPAMTPQVPDSM